MRLHDLLDRVASAEQPPSRLEAARIFAGGRRRRRRARVVRGVGAVGAMGVALAVVLSVSSVTRSEQSEVTGDSANPFLVNAVGGSDREHLWVWGEVSPGGGYVLATTRDGGRTWARRNEPDPRDRASVAADIGLIEAVDGRGGVSAFVDYRAGGVTYTTDHWRTRGQAKTEPVAVDGATRDALVLCPRPRDPATLSCVVSVFDPGGRRFAPLAKQPPLAAGAAARAPDGTIWVSGVDAGSRLPMVASSADGGRTWAPQVLAELGARPGERAQLFGGFSFGTDGAVLLMTLDPSAAAQQLMRRTGGRWQRLPDVAPRSEVATWLTADGTHILQDVQASAPRSPSADPSPGVFISPGPSTYRVVGIRACPPGADTYSSAAPPRGLPVDQAMIGRVESLAGGGYLGWNYGGIWSSLDGVTWRQVSKPTP